MRLIGLALLRLSQIAGALLFLAFLLTDLSYWLKIGLPLAIGLGPSVIYLTLKQGWKELYQLLSAPVLFVASGLCVLLALFAVPAIAAIVIYAKWWIALGVFATSFAVVAATERRTLAFRLSLGAKVAALFSGLFLAVVLGPPTVRDALRSLNYWRYQFLRFIQVPA